jgi:SAM-dependent methyltransferase
VAAADERVTRGRLFDAVADLYDEARPDYPAETYDAIDTAVGGLHGRRVLDLAAGPGIATRALVGRGARVVAADIGIALLRRLRTGSPDVAVTVAAAEALPFRTASFEVVTCATAWHWLDTAATLDQLRTIVVRGGFVALWWANHRHGDGVDWEDAQSAVYDRWQTRRGSRGTPDGRVGPGEAAADLRGRGLDVVVERTVEWTRDVDRDAHLRVLATHSDVLALGAAMPDFLADVAAALAPWPMVRERLSGPLVVARLT